MTRGTTIPINCIRACALAAFVLLPSLGWAQATVTSADIQRLQDEIYQVSSDVSRMRQSGSTNRLQEELDDLRDEVVYLKVRLRKEGRVPRAEYVDVRDRIASLRSRARGTEYSPSAPSRRDTYPPAGVPGTYPDDRRVGGVNDIPSGQEIDVRLQTDLSSATAQVEDRFEATTVVDVYRGNEVLIPAGSVMRGVVRTVEKATRTDRKGQITVSFDQMTVRGRTYPMRGTVSQALESGGIREEAARIGTGSAVGAIIGGIIGGVKGALLGVLIGGGGMIAATEGKDVHVPAGTILRVRMDSPPDIR